MFRGSFPAVGERKPGEQWWTRTILEGIGGERKGKMHKFLEEGHCQTEGKCVY